MSRDLPVVVAITVVNHTEIVVLRNDGRIFQRMRDPSDTVNNHLHQPKFIWREIAPPEAA